MKVLRRRTSDESHRKNQGSRRTSTVTWAPSPRTQERPDQDKHWSSKQTQTNIEYCVRCYSQKTFQCNRRGPPTIRQDWLHLAAVRQQETIPRLAVSCGASVQACTSEQEKGQWKEWVPGSTLPMNHVDRTMPLMSTQSNTTLNTGTTQHQLTPVVAIVGVGLQNGARVRGNGEYDRAWHLPHGSVQWHTATENQH